MFTVTALQSIAEAEHRAVVRTVAFARRARLIRIAEFATRLGNGWGYVLASAFLLLIDVTAVAASALSLGLAFLIYPPLKRRIARLRPALGEHSPSSLAPLDRYSFPSGHTMTAAAFGVPLLLTWPSAAPLVVGGCAVMSWSRVALAHHYVTDVVAGTILGALVAALVHRVMF